jgi:hypothetical protein
VVEGALEAARKDNSRLQSEVAALRSTLRRGAPLDEAPVAPTEAVELDEAKVELARLYAAESDRVKAAKDIIAKSLPEALDGLRKRHDAFQTLLQANLTVLATAHAVSEGIIRGVSGELARKRAPQIYDASGRETHPSPRAAQPLALSRVL